MNLGKSALQVLEAVAPTIATALGGPMAGSAVTWLENWITSSGKVAAEATSVEKQKAVEQALLVGDPQTLVALKTLETNFQSHMADLGVERDKLTANDVVNARSREIAIRDKTPMVLSYALLIGFFVVLGLLIFKGTPRDGGGEALLVLLGSLATAFISVIGYYFGSSAGSASKTEAINKIAVAKS
jgi:hypothetical protein